MTTTDTGPQTDYARLRAEFLRLLTTDSETKDRRRRDFNLAIFNAEGGWAVWTDTDLDMVMDKFDKAARLAAHASMSEPRTEAAKDADYKHAYIVGRNRCKCGKEFLGEWKGYAFHLEDVLTTVAAEREAATPPLDVLILPRELLESLVDDEECRFDHHGGCQAHGYLSLEPGELCPQADLKGRLAQQDGTEE